MKLDTDFSKDLNALRQALGADFAIISFVEGNDYEVLAMDSDLDLISVGNHFEIQNTYCNEVLNQKHTVVYNHVGSIEEMVRHPIYTTIQLEAYIGEPLKKDGDIIGTLNFSSFKKKDPIFSEEEIAEVQALARKVEKAFI